jgi:phosphopantothenoylcysteine decarboxylase / phosphopantothenate---cysteine ligase
VRAGIFSAAVADYRPEEVLAGKTPSGGALETLRLVPTPKVIARIRQAFPQLHMVTFKYEEDVSHEELMATARGRLEQGFHAVVANRGEERGPAGDQVAYLLASTGEPVRLAGKRGIARGIADYLERVLADR